jgi:hypothetical protein
MTDTSDFEVWLAENEPDGHEDIYSLYQAVECREDYGIWSVKVRGEKTFVTGPEGTLQLLSEKARQAFLKEVEALKDDDELDMESWYGFHDAMAKDD